MREQGTHRGAALLGPRQQEAHRSRTQQNRRNPSSVPDPRGCPPVCFPHGHATMEGVPARFGDTGDLQVLYRRAPSCPPAILHVAPDLSPCRLLPCSLPAQSSVGARLSPPQRLGHVTGTLQPLCDSRKGKRPEHPPPSRSPCPRGPRLIHHIHSRLVCVSPRRASDI